MADKIFVNGLISKDIPDTAPDWILGKHSIKVQDLIDWLTANKHLADKNGWINTVTKRSQTTGKRFIEVDTWQPNQQQEPTNTLTGQEAEDNKALIDQARQIRQQALESGEVNPDDIPF
jgi:hypothetical protein